MSRPDPAQLLRALLIAVGIAAATWVLVLLFMAMAIGVGLGNLLGAVAGQSARSPWWLETGPALAAMVLLLGTQVALTSLAVRRIGRPSREVFSVVPGMLLAVLLGPLPFGSFVWVQHAARERRVSELNAELAQEQGEDQRRAEHEKELRAAEEARAQRDQQERERHEQQEHEELQREMDETRAKMARAQRAYIEQAHRRYDAARAAAGH